MQTILISRTDGIGDVILTLPLAGLLKEQYPACRIVFLCASYTAPVVRCCEHVDDVLDWTVLQQESAERQVDRLRAVQADVILHVFPRKHIARLARLAGIPERIGTSHRLYNLWYCNRLVSLGRKNSDLHEAQLNIVLARRLLPHAPPPPDQLYRYYGLTRVPSVREEIHCRLDAEKFNLVLHTKSRGSAVEWSLEQWQEFITLLPDSKVRVFLTGTAEEGRSVRHLADHFPHVTDLTGTMTLEELIGFIGAADGLVAASTGPLHIAAALGRPVLGLFGNRRPIHAGRWAPLGEKAAWLEGEVDESGRLAILPETVFKKVLSWLV